MRHGPPGLRVLRWLGLALLLPVSLHGQIRLKPGVTVRSLELAVSRDPNDVAALYDLALGYWSKKRWDDAERSLRLALAIEPRNAPALLALAHLPFARRPQLQEEEESGNVPPEWQPVLITSEHQVRLAFLIDPLVDLQIVGAVAPDESSLLRQRSGATLTQTLAVGLANFRNGQYDQAYAWFDRFARLLGEGSDSARVPGFVYYYRGLAAAHLNDYPTAIRDFRTLHATREGDEIGMFGTDPTLDTYILAWLLDHQGQRDEAIALYEDALAQDLSLWMAHVQLAHVHEERGEWTDALRERQLAVEAAPDDPSLLLDLGITQLGVGHAEDALATLGRAGAALPRNFRVAYFEGVAAQQLGRADSAKMAYRRFLALVPSRFTDKIEEVRGRLRALP